MSVGIPGGLCGRSLSVALNPSPHKEPATMPLSARERAAIRDRVARAQLEETSALEDIIGAIGPFEIRASTSEYHDETDRLAVWIGEEMLDPTTARALAFLILAAADRCDGGGYSEVQS